MLRLLAVGLLALCSVSPAAARDPGDAEKETKPVLRHVVLFQFKDSVTEAEVQEVVDAFAKLPSQIDEIVSLEYGTDVGVENLAGGFTHGWVVTFASAKDRDAYLPHPAHAAFGKLVKPRLEKVLVFDFVAKTPAE